MRTANSWNQLLQIEPEFLSLEKQIRAAEIFDYRQITPEFYAWHAWDLINQNRLFDLILPFLRQQIIRARQYMPEIYASQLNGINVDRMRTLQDWCSVPLLVKDDEPDLTLRGFRSLAAAQPEILRPTDLTQAVMAFASGGSLGTATPTFVTLQDRSREIYAWRRGHAYHGLVPGDSALYTYNTTHKGGQWMQESLLAHGVQTHLRRPEDTARDILEAMRRHKVNVLFTVQQPLEAQQSQSKSAGINLHALIAASLENPDLSSILLPETNSEPQIKFIFLGGFPIVPYAMELIRDYLDNLPAATLLGSSEAIPQACSTNPLLTPGAPCHYNNLHLLQSPHYVEVVKPGKNDQWIPIERGETGLLVYTSWARDGTIWIRYAPGDIATLLLEEGDCSCGLQSPVITNVQRRNMQERANLLEYGCAAG
jgi:phenylacetate-CoA ligase